MYPGAIYPKEVLKERFIEVFGEEKAQSLFRTLTNESKKTNAKIIKYVTDDGLAYKLNPEFNFEDEREVAESEDVTRMAEVILEMVRKKNNEALSNWLQNDLYDVLETIITDKVKVEFETEVIPVLKEYIDKSVAHKLENSKGDFKKLLLGVIADLIKSIDD
jgi:hypothetical protein